MSLGLVVVQGGSPQHGSWELALRVVLVVHLGSFAHLVCVFKCFCSSYHIFVVSEPCLALSLIIFTPIIVELSALVKGVDAHERRLRLSVVRILRVQEDLAVLVEAFVLAFARVAAKAAPAHAVLSPWQVVVLGEIDVVVNRVRRSKVNGGLLVLIVYMPVAGGDFLHILLVDLVLCSISMGDVSSSGEHCVLEAHHE